MAAGVLHVVGGTDRGKRFELVQGETRIGRGADQDVVLSDIAVSRKHITIGSEGARYRLRDLGSGNGTLVNGQRIDSVILNDGDHIELGNTVLRFNQAGMGQQPGPPQQYGGPPGMAPPPTASNFGQVQSPFQQPNQPSPFAAPQPQQPAYEPPPPVQPRPLHHAPTQAPHLVGASTMAPEPMRQSMPPAAAPARTMAPRAVPMAMGRRAPARSGPLDSPLKKALVFGGMGFVCLAGLGVIVNRTVMAKPAVVPSEAEEQYRQGLRSFTAGDYEGAKINFQEAALQAPDAPEPKRYVKQCEGEIRGRANMKVAERSLAGRRYAEAMRSLEAVEEGTLAFDQAARLKRENGPRAAAEELEEAKRFAASDVAAAQTRLEHALQLDPRNEEAAALLAKLRGGKPVAVAPAPVAAPAPRVKEERAPKPAPAPPPAPRAEKVEAAVGAGSLSDAKTALAAYKNKDFAGAMKGARVDAMSQTGKQSAKTLELANQIKLLVAAVDRATANEARNPAEAVKDLNEAMALDARIAKGMHAAYFKQRIGKVQLASAQQAFQATRYDAAYQSVLLAQKYGAGDGGMLKQLEAKAGELVQKGQSMQKSNINQAKTMWRMVLKMVPTSSPTYAKAYQLLNSAAGAARDEDE